MKLALTLSYSGAQMSLDMERILEVERLGFDSVWSAESYGSDAVTPAAWIAARTARIHVGTGIMQLAARSPAATAMTAMTLDGLSGGRFRLGLGVSGPQVVEGWHGQPFGKPPARTREDVAIVRRARGVRHHADGPGRRGGRRRRVPAPGEGEARAVRRRHGSARPELLQRRRASLRLRGGGQDDPGPLPRGAEGGGRDRGAGRARGRGRALRAAGADSRAARRVERVGGHDAPDRR